ncbi:DNA topoisomerase III, partial [Apiospora rasikravindrae]
MKILCVAEKPSIAKAVAEHLSGGRSETRNTRNKYIKNYVFDYDFGGQPWGNCTVTMTSVLGHISAVEFPSEYKDWRHPPPERLFDAPVNTVIADDKKDIAQNIETQARYSQGLCIWTDCDREGEHIGHEIREAARKGNAALTVKRARFSNIERAHILHAARHLIMLDDRQVNAVAARIELDLRIGYALTRFLSNNLKSLGGPLANLVISYGSCQFPTLGFVVDRTGSMLTFPGRAIDFFDRASVIILYERCLAAKTAVVTKVQEKPTKKWKPLPLTTVELQKMSTRFLRMTGQQAMTAAESLYNKGFISYPRTETDRFDKGMNLRTLVQKQAQDNRWGAFAQNLMNGGFQQPRDGRHDDKAHPPIHPITYAGPSAALNEFEKKIYEFVVRRFLACCSEDAKGVATDIDILYGEESFHAHGVIVLERNYLEVYVYEKWTGTAELPKFTLDSPPSYLTEADLIALMDANGIGTDATMAEHIQKIQDRDYVRTVPRSGRQDGGDDDADNSDEAPTGRGGRGGRGSRGGARGRGGRRGAAAPQQARGGGGNGIHPNSPGGRPNRRLRQDEFRNQPVDNTFSTMLLADPEPPTDHLFRFEKVVQQASYERFCD